MDDHLSWGFDQQLCCDGGASTDGGRENPELRGFLDVCQGFRDARQRVVHRLVDRGAILGGQPVFPVPNVERRFLERNLFDVFVLDPDRCAHFLFAAPLVPPI